MANDILCLQETWEVDSIHLNGYRSFHTPVIPSPAGRAKGGLLTLLSNTFPLKVKSFLNTSPYYHIILLQFYSSFYNNNFGSNHAAILGLLGRDIADLEKACNKPGDIIWLGDFNAHPCNMINTPVSGLVDDDGVFVPHFSHNDYGNGLNRLVIVNNLVFLNTFETSTGQLSFTLSSRSHSLTLDCFGL